MLREVAVCFECFAMRSPVLDHEVPNRPRNLVAKLTRVRNQAVQAVGKWHSKREMDVASGCVLGTTGGIQEMVCDPSNRQSLFGEQPHRVTPIVRYSIQRVAYQAPEKSFNSIEGVTGATQVVRELLEF